jgi:hypothetical protein
VRIVKMHTGNTANWKVGNASGLLDAVAEKGYLGKVQIFNGVGVVDSVRR